MFRRNSYIIAISIFFRGKLVATDPICKMSVSEGQAKYTTVRNDKKYYFCSAACKQEFEKNPTKYA
ncbi:MAG: YHS domain-containing protein [Candidatus Bathyarchaeia archaeon]